MTTVESERRPVAPAGKTPAAPSGFVGAELGPTVLRAAVFSSTFELLGRIKLSTKPERGRASVLDRLERCVRYVLDECDVTMNAIRAVGIAVPGVVNPETGGVTLDADFGWPSAVPLAQEMTARLGCPVAVDNAFNVIARAVHHFERAPDGTDAGVLIPGAVLGAGLVIAGQPQDLSEFPPEDPLLPPGAGQVVSRTDHPQFRHFRSREFRKAVRKGHQPAQEFLQRSVVEAMTFAARLVRMSGVKHLVLAGGAIDENKEEMVTEARRALASILGPAEADRVTIRSSDLGDLAVLIGAALVGAMSVAR